MAFHSPQRSSRPAPSALRSAIDAATTPPRFSNQLGSENGPCAFTVNCRNPVKGISQPATLFTAGPVCAQASYRCGHNRSMIYHRMGSKNGQHMRSFVRTPCLALLQHTKITMERAI